MKKKDFFKQKKTIVITAVALLLVVISAVFFFVKRGETKSTAGTSSSPMQIGQEKDGVTLTRGNDKIQIQLCQDDILRIHHIPNGKSSENTIVIGNTKWNDVKAEYDLKANPAVIKTAKVTVKVDKNTGYVSVYDLQGKSIVKELDINTGSNKRSKDSVALKYEGDQSFYGISGYTVGDPPTGITREDQSYLVQAGTQGYCGGPFVWTNSGYGLLVDSDGGSFDLYKDTKEIYFSSSSRADKDAYLMVGNPSEIMGELSKVTGQAPMFPKWAVGFTNSQWGLTEDKLLNIVDTYRSKKIPIDNFTLDFDWKAWGEDNYGEFRWNDKNFPDGSSGKLASILASKGVKLTGILKPRIHAETVQGKLVTDNKWWLEYKGFSDDYFSHKQVGDLDFSKEDVRKWYFENVLKGWKTGFAGWWLDEADEVSPNFQFMNMERSLYEGYRGVSNERVWSINRNFYVGAQKYAYGMWSGDISTGFDSMKAQRDRMLSAINLGEAKWGMDTGGFNGTPDSENYARWMQFSALTPIFRVHGGLEQVRQPWIFGDVAEKAAVKAINLRYKLIPYIYSYDRRAYEQGVGLVKPLVFDYPKDKNAANDVDAWMFGDYILASPVVDQGVSSVKIYLPQGKWIDYERGTVYDGGQTIDYKVDSATWQDIPMFIKEGAIIPSQDVMNYVGEKPVDKVYVDMFPSQAKSEFKYYDDDGKTYNYEKGEYFAQNITQQDQGSSVAINISKVDGSYKPELKYYVFRVHGQFSGAASGSGEMKKASDEKALMAADEECVSTGKDVYGDYTVIKVKAGDEKDLKLAK